MVICVQGAQNWQKDTAKQQFTASSLLLLVLRHVVPSLPRPVDMPNWRYLKKGEGEMAFSWSEWWEPPNKAWKTILPPLRLWFLSCLHSRILPAHSPLAILSPEVLLFCPNLLIHCSTAPCTSLNFTCPTSKAIQNSTSAYTFVLIISAPTLGCIPAPFLINPISHTPGFMASPMPSCMLTQVPWSLNMFLLKSAAKLPYCAFPGPEPDL